MNLRKGPEYTLVNPFTPEEEWVRLESRNREERFAAADAPQTETPTLRITAIDLTNKTITLE